MLKIHCQSITEKPEGKFMYKQLKHQDIKRAVNLIN